MTSTKEGWVVINIGHPRTGSRFIVESTFRFKRTDAIKDFTDNASSPWAYWKRKFNYRVVRATQNITLA